MLYRLLQKKKCKNCRRLSHKDVLFCWGCGRSFDYRICASGHKNPPWVQYCLTCGKDRSLMSRPHSSENLWFAKHPKKQSTYVPGHRKSHYALAWVAVVLGLSIICAVAFLVANNKM
jgi:hypothetical protein